MKRRNLFGLLTVLLVLCAGAALGEATCTDLAQADYEDMVSTYSIDTSIPSYKEYLARYENTSVPTDEIVIEAAEALIRYEEDGVAA